MGYLTLLSVLNRSLSFIQSLRIQSVVTELFEILSEIIEGLFSALADAFEGITKIFYTSTDGFSFVGVLLLIGFGVFFVMFAFNFIKTLIKR